MKWTEEAENAIGKVPFFVRKIVRKKVEEEARQAEARTVTIRHVRTSQQRFLRNMEDEIQGYRVETCFGPQGCRNRAAADDDLADKIDKILASRNLKRFLRETIPGKIKMHHEFRISISDCPNACSRPQIVDLGLLGACRPEVTGEQCSECGACASACAEDAVSFPDISRSAVPVIDRAGCLQCGQCATVCPTGTIIHGKRGYRILVGGKLGRHPRLGMELPEIYSSSDVLDIVERCIDHFMLHNRQGERFGDILARTGMNFLF
ncbi:MAG TPA: 4Fe-4S dicluster domain-containing protein [Thermodesulfobacteriaceae bacterium]|nr:4Fe-4S dicluster domain-containing protein [Thermodesulfobacteriaceae bacterium]